MNNDLHTLDKKVELLDQKIELIVNNHLAHLQKDVDWIKYVIYGTAVGVIALLAKSYLP